MERKYLIALAVGLGVIVLAVVAGALFYQGNSNEGAAVTAVALAAAEAARRGREASNRELELLHETAEESDERLERIAEEFVADMEDTDNTVDNTTLSELIEEEQGRLS
jgi:hypothetical protein